MKEYSQEKVDEAIKEMLKGVKVPNILICGQTGTGKSSAVNFIFKNDAIKKAEVGENGIPQTRDITLYAGKNINLYDSEGYEIGGEKQARYEKLIFDDFLIPRKGLSDKAIHLIWYTISGAGKRFTDLDIKIIKRMEQEQYCVCVLLTKIDALDEVQEKDMVDALHKELPKKIKVFRLSTVEEEAVQKFCDWDKLIEWSYEKLPDVFRDRFVSGLKQGLKEKRSQADEAIVWATSGAGIVGLSPIPFSDAALLVPIQTALILKILSIYGIELKDGAIPSLISAVGVSALGKSAAGSLLKIIPGIGTLFGSMINAGVAVSITAAIGKALSETCYNQCNDMLNGKKIVMSIEDIISSVSFINLIKHFL
jgi:uncharacterized protein (DUF697 family)/GTP-binding protein EngB required for normal cell division